MVGFLGLLLEGMGFILAVAFYFFVPGNLLLVLLKQKFPVSTYLFLSLGIGAIFFTLVTYSLSWLRMPLLIVPITIVIFYLSLRRKVIQKKLFLPERKLPILLVGLAAVFFSLQMIPNGNIGNEIYFFGDDPAHLAYISELRFAFPPEHPGFAGIPLRGYHFFYDFLIAQFANMTYLSHFSLYFHFMPLLIALGWAFGSYSLLLLWTKRISAGLWASFFTLFGGSFGYVLTLVNHPGMTLTSNFGIDQPDIALRNGPYAFSVILVLLFLHLLLWYLRTRDTKLLYILSIAVGITPMFKVYAGILMIAGFGCLIVYELFKKNKHALSAGFLAGSVFLGTFGVFAGSGAGIFYFPLWPVERMFQTVFPDYGYSEKIRTFTEQGVIRGLMTTHLYTISVFLIGNLGTRFLGIILLPLLLLRKKKLSSVFAGIVTVMLGVSVLFPFFFGQTIKVFDMIQMTWYYPLFASFFAALGFSYFFSLRFPGIFKIGLAALLVIATIPTASAGFFANSLPLLTVQRQSHSSDYFQAMEWLRENGSYEEAVLDLPVGRKYTTREGLIGWYTSTSAHIPAFGEKRMYVGNQYILFPNMPIDERLAFMAKINTLEHRKKKDAKDVQRLISELKMKNISYIYTVTQLTLFQNTSVSPVYHNPSVIIYRVR